MKWNELFPRGQVFRAAIPLPAVGGLPEDYIILTADGSGVLIRRLTSEQMAALLSPPDPEPPPPEAA